MPKCWCLIIIVCLVSVPAEYYAQSASLKILSVKGKPRVHTIGKSDYIEAVIGSEMYKNQELVLGQNNYCALAASTGGTIELKDSSHYSYDVLIQLIGKQKRSLTKGMVDYVAENMVIAKKSNAMKMLGAVVRTSSNQIDISVPNHTILLSDTLSVSWYGIGKQIQYLCNVTRKDGKTVLMKIVSDTSITINCAEIALQQGEEYFCFIKSVNEKPFYSDTITFSCAQKNVTSAILDTINATKSIDDFTSSAVGNISVALYLERYNFNASAENYLKKAVELSNGAEGFLEHYLQFLMQTGQDKKALECKSKYVKSAE
jgi:hypothetical protein